MFKNVISAPGVARVKDNGSINEKINKAKNSSNASTTIKVAESSP